MARPGTGERRVAGAVGDQLGVDGVGGHHRLPLRPLGVADPHRDRPALGQAVPDRRRSPRARRPRTPSAGCGRSPSRRRASSAASSLVVTSTPATMPSSTATSAGPWDSPAVIQRSTHPSSPGCRTRGPPRCRAADPHGGSRRRVHQRGRAGRPAASTGRAARRALPRSATEHRRRERARGEQGRQQRGERQRRPPRGGQHRAERGRQLHVAGAQRRAARAGGRRRDAVAATAAPSTPRSTAGRRAAAGAAARPAAPAGSARRAAGGAARRRRRPRPRASPARAAPAPRPRHRTGSARPPRCQPRPPRRRARTTVAGPGYLGAAGASSQRATAPASRPAPRAGAAVIGERRGHAVMLGRWALPPPEGAAGLWTAGPDVDNHRPTARAPRRVTCQPDAYPLLTAVPAGRSMIPSSACSPGGDRTRTTGSPYAVHRGPGRPGRGPRPRTGSAPGVRPRSSRPLRGAARRELDHAQARRAPARRRSSSTCGIPTAGPSGSP